MKKINAKSLILGLVIGLSFSVFTFTGLASAIQEYVLYRADYNVVIDGQNYTDAELPILNYKGHTYAPLRSMLSKSGLEIAWDAQSRTANIKNPNRNNESDNVDNNSDDVDSSKTDDVNDDNTNSNNNEEPKEDNNMNEEKPFIIYTPDNVKAVLYEDIYYISNTNIKNKANDFGYDLKLNIKVNEFELINNNNNTIVIKSIPTTIIYGTSSVEYNYYINNIMPIFQEQV